MRAGGAEDGGAVGGVDGDAGMLGADRGGDRLAAVELLEEVAIVGVGFVGGGEVGPDGGQLEVGIGVDRAGEREDLVAVEGAEPAHAAVVLEVDAGGMTGGAGAGGDLLAEALGPDRDGGAGAERQVELGGGERAERDPLYAGG